MNMPEDDQTRKELEGVISPEDLDELEAIAADIIDSVAAHQHDEDDDCIIQRTFTNVGKLMSDLVQAADSDCNPQRVWVAAVKVMTDMVTSIGLSEVTKIDEASDGEAEGGQDQGESDAE